MASNPIKFCGTPAKRVLIVFQENSVKNYTNSDYEFIRQSFNRVRNYREFTVDYMPDILEATSGKLPSISSMNEGDACLLVGCGRLIDENSYRFAERCIMRGIPVYFVRLNTLDFDSRATDSIWKTTSLTVKTSTGKKFYAPPAKYFMEIPRVSDFIRLNRSDDFYALLPAMVPFA